MIWCLGSNPDGLWAFLGASATRLLRTWVQKRILGWSMLMQGWQKCRKKCTNQMIKCWRSWWLSTKEDKNDWDRGVSTEQEWLSNFGNRNENLPSWLSWLRNGAWYSWDEWIGYDDVSGLAKAVPELCNGSAGPHKKLRRTRWAANESSSSQHLVVPYITRRGLFHTRFWNTINN